MLNNKKLSVVLSVVIAVVLWIYVIGKINPIINQSYSNIPINLVNENILNDKGLAVLSVSDNTMNVTISGSRKDMANVDVSKIYARVDVAKLSEGQNEVEIHIVTPEGTKLEEKSLSKITIVTDKLVQREKPIKVVYKGAFDETEEPTTVSQSLDQITVEGAQKKVDEVAYIQASVSSSELSEEEVSVTSNLEPVNTEGTRVNNVSINQRTIKVEAFVSRLKEVSLVVPVVDNSDGEVTKKTTAPDKVTIKGKRSLIEKIDSITAKAIDITDIKSDTSIPIELDLPNGVMLSDSNKKLNLKVTAETSKTKSFNLNGSAVELSGLLEGKTANILTGTIKVTVSGTADMLEKISEKSISLSADLAGLDEGIHNVRLKVSCSETNSGISSDPQMVRIEIK